MGTKRPLLCAEAVFLEKSNLFCSEVCFCTKLPALRESLFSLLLALPWPLFTHSLNLLLRLCPE